MRRLAIALVPALAAAALCIPSAAAPQKRVQQKGPADFAATMTSAQEAWNQGKYGACMEHLKEATGLVVGKRIEAILSALPAAPAGFELVDSRKDQAQANQMMAGMSAVVGNIIEQEYRGPYRLKVTVTADSPMVQMFSMSMNPAMLDKDSELIEYENGHKAILKKTSNGRTRDLTLVIAGKHIAQTDFGGDNEEALLGMWSQAAVDNLAAALSN